jgi:hypothetical protein
MASNVYSDHSAELTDASGVLSWLGVASFGFAVNRLSGLRTTNNRLEEVGRGIARVFRGRNEPSSYGVV